MTLSHSAYMIGMWLTPYDHEAEARIGVPARRLRNRKYNHAETNRRFAVVLEACSQAPQQDARIGAQALIVPRIGAVSHHK